MRGLALGSPARGLFAGASRWGVRLRSFSWQASRWGVRLGNFLREPRAGNLTWGFCCSLALGSLTREPRMRSPSRELFARASCWGDLGSPTQQLFTGASHWGVRQRSFCWILALGSPTRLGSFLREPRAGRSDSIGSFLREPRAGKSDSKVFLRKPSAGEPDSGTFCGSIGESGSAAF